MGDRVQMGSGTGGRGAARSAARGGKSPLLPRACTIAALVGLLGCHEGQPFTVIRTGPVTAAEIPGSWDAVELIFMDDSGPTDALAAGGGLLLILGADLQVSGHLNVPGQGPGGTDLDEDMDGVWSYDPVNRVLRFVQDADTFVGRARFDVTRREDGGVAASAFLPGEDDAPDIEITIEKR